jgi:hypothetical protein
MFTRFFLFTSAVLLLVATVGRAEPLPVLDADSTRPLAMALRKAILQLLPNPLYESSPGWGQMREVQTGWKVTGHGLHSRLEAVRSPRNDGLWRKIRVVALRPSETFSLDLRELRQAGPGRLTFTAALALDVHLSIEQQRWKAGVRLYSASLEARLHVKLQLDCEAEADLDFKDGTLPDVIFRLRLVRANLDYDNLVVEHAAGLGGTAARWLGEAVRSGLHRFDPAVERHALERADVTLVRAFGTREVRLSLGRLLEKLGPLSIGSREAMNSLPASYRAHSLRSRVR